MKFLLFAPIVLLLSIQADAQTKIDTLEKEKLDSAMLVGRLEQINNAFSTVAKYENHAGFAQSVPTKGHDAELYKNAVALINSITSDGGKGKQPGKVIPEVDRNKPTIGLDMPPAPASDLASAPNDNFYQPLADDYEGLLQSLAKSSSCAAHLLRHYLHFDTGTWMERYAVRKSTYDIIKMTCK